jgi:hypothetical protein
VITDPERDRRSTNTLAYKNVTTLALEVPRAA